MPPPAPYFPLRMGKTAASWTLRGAKDAEQIDTWKDVYGIDERYRAKLCRPDAKAWATEV